MKMSDFEIKNSRLDNADLKKKMHTNTYPHSY